MEALYYCKIIVPLKTNRRLPTALSNLRYGSCNTDCLQSVILKTENEISCVTILNEEKMKKEKMKIEKPY